MYLEGRKTALKRRCCRKNRFNDLKRYYAAMLAKFSMPKKRYVYCSAPGVLPQAARKKGGNILPPFKNIFF